MRLQHCTWPEVEAYLGRSRDIVVPIGSTEQHGPNGLIGTDAICPEAIALGAAERIGCMVAPTLSIGMAQHHMAFAGTITLRPATLVAVIRDVVDSLARHGFERIYFLNGHGGNIATITAAFSEIYADRSMERAGARPPVQLRLGNWFGGERARNLAKELYGDAEGSHATPSEVSLSWYAAGVTKSAEMNPPVAPRGVIRDAEDYRRQFPDGRIGSNPGLASVEHGERLWRAGVEDLIADYQAFVG